MKDFPARLDSITFHKVKKIAHQNGQTIKGAIKFLIDQVLSEENHAPKKPGISDKHSSDANDNE